MGNRNSRRGSKDEGGDNTNTTQERKSNNKKQGPGAAYLVFTNESGGTLTVHISRTKVSNSIANYVPKKDFAGFKYTNNAGRQELGRKFGVEKKNFLEAYARL